MLGVRLICDVLIAAPSWSRGGRVDGALGTGAGWVGCGATAAGTT